MKAIAFAALALLASPALAMGTKPTVTAGSDTILRADVEALTAKHQCALPKLVGKTAKSIARQYYEVALEAAQKGNGTMFADYRDKHAAFVVNTGC